MNDVWFILLVILVMLGCILVAVASVGDELTQIRKILESRNGK